MASLRQKPSGRWEARYRDPSGVMRARTFSTKTEARAWVRETETDVRRGDWIDPRLTRTTFEQWADEYLLTIVHLREITRGDYTRIVDVHLLPAFGDWPISQIEQVDVRRLIAEKQAAGLAPKTLQKIRLVLRQILETARGSGAIKANPCEGIRMPRATQVDPVFLTPDEVERLALATRAPYDVLVRMAAGTGMRPSELCGLQVGRINLVSGTVDVVEALTVVRGHVELGPTKNGVRRTVGLTRSLCDDLGKHLLARANELDRALEPDDFVFVAPQGGPLRRDLLYKRIFVPAVKDAGLRPGLRLHDLRHTCAALLIQLGAHPKVIQEWLGHRSITVTMDVYGHLYPSLTEALTERLDEVLTRARAPEKGRRAVVPIRHRR
jgi:integrase